MCARAPMCQAGCFGSVCKKRGACGSSSVERKVLVGEKEREGEREREGGKYRLL